MMMMIIIMSMSEMALIDYCLIRSVCSKMFNDVQQATKLCKTCSNHLGGQNKLTHKVVIFLLIRNNIPKHWTDLMKACCWPPNNNKKRRNYQLLNQLTNHYKFACFFYCCTKGFVFV